MSVRLICQRLAAPALLLLVACVAPACQGTAKPTSEIFTTDTFSQTLDVQSVVTHQFVTTVLSNVAVTLASVTPPTSAVIGVDIGTFAQDGSGCVPQVFQPSLHAGDTFSVSQVPPGTYCIAVFDPGTLTDSVTYVVRVNHH